MNDGVLSGTSGWGSDTAAAGEYLQADLGAGRLTSRVQVAGGTLTSWGGTSAYLNGRFIEYSHDGSSWTRAVTFTSVTDIGSNQTVSFTFPPVVARYWRLTGTSWVSTMEFRIGN